MEIDFNTAEVVHDNGVTKWYVSPYFMSYLAREQSDNLPKLEGYGCFVVKGDGVEDYVLIDSSQSVLAHYPYPAGAEQMEAKINIMKISKNYDDHENL